MSDFSGKSRAVMGFLWEQAITRRIVLWSTVLYALVYLWAIGDISLHGWRPVMSVTVTRAPLELLFEQRNLFYFEGIAIINLPVVTWLFSPVNLVIALALALLVGLNLALSYVSVRQPRVCRGRPSHALLASVPALLAGTTCSIPVVLVVLGVQISGAVLAFFSALVPIALVALAAALVFNIRRTDVEALQQLSRQDRF